MEDNVKARDMLDNTDLSILMKCLWSQVTWMFITYTEETSNCVVRDRQWTITRCKFYHKSVLWT